MLQPSPLLGKLRNDPTSPSSSMQSLMERAKCCTSRTGFSELARVQTERIWSTPTLPGLRLCAMGSTKLCLTTHKRTQPVQNPYCPLRKPGAVSLLRNHSVSNVEVDWR